jgi:hypothetical protein
MASQHEAQPLPPICRLPIELLSDILSLVVPSVIPPDFQPHRRRFNRNHPAKIIESPFHCVRSTCRTFRRIADQLPFWSVDDFDINDILNFEPERSGPSLFGPEDTLPPYSPYLEAVLADSHLQGCLDRKTSWFVANAVLWETLVHSMPNFGRHAQYLKLNGNGYCDYPYGHVTPTLFEIFPVLTHLEIESNDHVCLDDLPETLKILNIIAPLVEDCDCENDLPNLEELDYTPLDGEMPLEFRRMLPLESTENFQELRFKFTPPWPPLVTKISNFFTNSKI